MLDGRVQPAARGGDRAPRRRHADQRLLQREPRLDAGGARAPRRASPASAARSPCSARWPSSASEALAYHREIGDGGRARRRRRRSSPSARSRAEYARAGRRRRARTAPRPPPRRPTRSRAAPRPATSCSSRARARWDSKRSRRNYAPRWHTSSSRRSSRSSSRSSPGPFFIDFLRRHSLGQTIREEGPEHHSVKQGTPTMGGVLIVLAATIAFLATTVGTLPALDDLRDDARLRRDRLPRRPDQGAPPALARPLGPDQDAAPARDLRARRASRRTTRSCDHDGLRPDRAEVRSRSAGAGTCSSSSSSPAPRTR